MFATTDNPITEEALRILIEGTPALISYANDHQYTTANPSGAVVQLAASKNRWNVGKRFEDAIENEIKREATRSGRNVGRTLTDAFSTEIFGDPDFNRAYNNAIKNTPPLTCETHVGQDMDGHLKAVLKQSGLSDYEPLIRLSFRMYNAHVLKTNARNQQYNSNPKNRGKERDMLELVRFQRDTVTGACYINGNYAEKAFQYYNGVNKNKNLPQYVPDPKGWADKIHNAPGYGADKLSLIDLGKDKFACGLKDSKRLHTIFLDKERG